MRGTHEYRARRADCKIWQQVIYDADAPTLTKPATPSAITQPISEIKPEILKWLWAGRFPLGKLALLVGDPDRGKSMCSVDIAAHVSRGAPFPDGAACQQGAVIMASAEDDPNDTIRPRLDSAGADVSRIHILEGMCITLSDSSTVERAFDLETGIPALEDALTRISDVRLVIIDPISAYLGGADSNTNAEVRGVLAPLAALAAKHAASVLCVTHLRKTAGPAVHRSIASIAFAAAARAVWAIAADPSDPDRRLMLAVKQNLAPNMGGLAFRIATENGQPRLKWEEGTVTLTANDVLGSVESRKRGDALCGAEAWLKQILVGGPVLVSKIEEEAKSAGLSWATVRRAKESLPVVTEKSSYLGGWQWRIEAAHVEGAQTSDTQLSAFDRVADKKEDNTSFEHEDAQENNMSIFEKGDL